MGLDNGIILTCKASLFDRVDYIVKHNQCELDSQHIYLPLDTIINDYKNHQVEIELCYWRKCYGLRDRMLQIVHPNNIFYYEIDHIIDLLKSFLNKDVYNEFFDSIWDYEEMKNVLCNQILTLFWLKDFLATKDPSQWTLEFYDSY